MAYDYGMDPMGNATGYVDQEAEAIALREEEERKRKEQEEFQRKQNEKLAKERDNLAVHKQEVTTYANGSKTITNVAEIPATSNAPGRPNAPKGPVSPETFARMQQAESGNRDFDAQGRPITSPVGAMFKNQVMPATAANPGYGIRPAQAQTPEEYNRVGQEYYQAMLKKFGGNEQAAVAAYNAGPGRIEQNMRKNQGQLNVAQLPNETQGYLNKVLGGVGKVVNAVVPSAQAAPAPSNLPQAFPEEGVAVATGRGVQGTPTIMGPVSPEAVNQQAQNEMEGLQQYARPQDQAPAPVAPEAIDNTPIPTAGGVGIRMPGQPSGVASSAPAIEAYGKIQDNPMELMKLGVSDDPNTPKWIKERARNRAADLVQQEREMEKAKQQVANMSQTDLAKTIRKKDKGEEGSSVKMFIYNLLGMNAHAAEEADKLGLGRETAVMGADGKPYLIKVGYNGKPISGYNPETSKDLTEDELIKVAAGATDMKNTKAHMMADAKGSPVTKTIDGKLVNGIQVYDPVAKTFVVKYGNKTDAQPEGWTSASQNVEQQAVLEKQKAQIDLYKKFEGASIDAKFKYIEDTNKALVAKFGTGAVLLTPEEFGLSRPSAGGKVAAVEPTPLPAGTQGATQAPAGGSVAPGQLPAAQGTQVSNIPATTAGGQKPPTLSAMNAQDAQQKIERELGQKSSEGVIKHRDEKLVPAAMAGQAGSEIVKRQFGILNDSRSDVLFGLYTKAQGGSKADKNWAIVRDILGGKLTTKEGQEISQAWVESNLTSDEQSLYANWKADNANLASAETKSGAFGAQISDRDRIAAEKMQLSIGETPALGMFNGKAQQSFGFDLNRAKSDWAAGKKFEAVDQLEKAWRQEQTKLVDQYGKVAEERNAFIKANSDGKAATIGLVRKAYQMYPVPQYDPNLNAGEGGWRNMPDRIQTLKQKLKGNQ